MESRQLFFNESQEEEDCRATQSAYAPPYFSYGTSPMSMAYTMSPHGFSALLTSSSPTSSMMFAPPRPHGVLPQGIMRDTSTQSQTILGVAYEGTPFSIPSKPCKNVSTNEGVVEMKSNGRKRGRIAEPNVKRQEVDDDMIEKKGNELWKDFWVEHLVHIRGGMNNNFNKMPKEGVDLWSKVATKLASIFSDCDKDAEVCRKKWGRVNKDYRADKAHNAISGNDRKRSCKWYDIVDEYMHDRANVVCKSHASALGEETSSSGEKITILKNEGVDINDNIEGQSSTSVQRTVRMQDDLLHQLAKSGKAMVSQMKEEAIRRATLKERRQSTLEAIQPCMAAFLESAKKD